MLNWALLRRRDVLIGGLLALAGAGARPVSAASDGGLSDDQLWTALQNTFWIAGHEPSERCCYVIAAPWCGVCRMLHNGLKEKTEFQARYILTGPRSPQDRNLVAYAALSQSREGLDAVYSRRGSVKPLGSAAAREFIVDVNMATETALMPALTARLATSPFGAMRFGYPTVVCRMAGRLVAFAGAPADLNRFISLLDKGRGEPGRSALTPFLNDPPTLIKAQGSAAARRSGVGVYVAPEASSPRLRALNKGDALTVAGEVSVNGEKWLALKVFSPGSPYGYGLAREFAR